MLPSAAASACAFVSRAAVTRPLAVIICRACLISRSTRARARHTDTAPPTHLDHAHTDFDWFQTLSRQQSASAVVKSHPPSEGHWQDKADEAEIYERARELLSVLQPGEYIHRTQRQGLSNIMEVAEKELYGKVTHHLPITELYLPTAHALTSSSAAQPSTSRSGGGEGKNKGHPHTRRRARSKPNAKGGMGG